MKLVTRSRPFSIHPGALAALPILLTALAILFAAVVPTALFAKSTTWTHGSAVDDLWSNADNWSNGVPANFDNVSFSAIGGTSTNDIPALMLNRLNMTGYAGTLTAMGTLQVTGTFTACGIVNLGAGDVAVAGDLLVNGFVSAPNATITIGGRLIISETLDCRPSGMVEVSGDITGSTGAVLEMGGGRLSAHSNALLADFAYVTWTPGGRLSCVGSSGLQRIAFGAAGVLVQNVTVSRAGAGDVTQIETPGGLTVNGTLTVSTGTLAFVESGTTSVPGTYGVSEGDVVVSGAASIQPSGRLEMDSRAVAGIEFSSTLTVRGEFSYTKPGGSVSLAAGPVGTVDITSGGAFTIVGAPPDRVHLEQDGIPGGEQWILSYDGTSTITVDGVEVQDGDAQGPSSAPATNSADRGNNTNWDFIGPKTTTWTGESLTSAGWSDPLNWDLGSPEDGDVVLFPAIDDTSMMDISGLTLASMDMSGYLGELAIGNPLNVTGDLTTAGRVLLNGNPLTVAGTFTVKGTTEAPQADIAVGGDIIVRGSLRAYEGGSVEVAGDVVGAQGGIIDLGSNTLRLGGDLLASDYTYVTWCAIGHLVCAGPASSQVISLGVTVSSLKNLTVDRAASDLVTQFESVGGTVAIQEDLEIARGVFEPTAGNLTVMGATTIEGDGKLSIESAGQMTRFGGPLDVRGTLSYTRAGGYIRFAADSAGAIDITNGGTFEIAGTVASRVHVQQDGTAGASRWLLVYDATSTIAVDAVEMQDADARGGPIAAATNSLNAGNCANWYFGPVSASETPVLALALEAAPNPFNPSTTIRYELPSAGAASIRIYDVTGSLVRTLVSAHHEAGRYRITWDGRNGAGRRVGSGAYFCRVESNAATAVRKLLLLR